MVAVQMEILWFRVACDWFAQWCPLFLFYVWGKNVKESCMLSPGVSEPALPGNVTRFWSEHQLQTTCTVSVYIVWLLLICLLYVVSISTMEEAPGRAAEEGSLFQDRPNANRCHIGTINSNPAVSRTTNHLNQIHSSRLSNHLISSCQTSIIGLKCWQE